MKYTFTFFLTVLIGVIALFVYGGENMQKQDNYAKLAIGNEVMKVELAKTLIQREKGLSGKLNLPENNGILFVFERPGLYSFWMKDMNFAIDIIWLDENMLVVDIKERAKPSSYPERFISDEPARYVLEANAGFVSSAGIKIGSSAKILK
jgi:uncharacterized membrane protein (UPF0127 family)